MSLYLSFREIQQYFVNFYENTKKTASLYDAVFNLYQQHKFHDLNYSKIHSSKNLPDQLIDSLLNLNLDILPIINNFSQSCETPSKNQFLLDQTDFQIVLLFQHEKAALHYHDYFEIDIVLTGQVQFTCQNETQTIKSNSIIFISPLAFHKIQVIDDSIIISLAIKKDILTKNFSDFLRNSNLLSDYFNHNLYASSCSFLLLHTKIDVPILKTLQQIIKESASDKLYSNRICCNYITNFFYYALRNSDLSPKVLDKNIFLPNKITSIIKLIQSHSDSISLTSISKKYGYSKAYLGKMIKKYKGSSFNQLRNYYRIQNSCYLLKFSDKSIEIISRQVGYNSINHFEYCFHKIMKTSPTKYRKKYVK